MSGFTPGPWVKGFHDSVTVEFDGGGSHYTLLAEGRDCPVALVPETVTGGWGNDAECEANARLIAASPALVEALQLVRGSSEWSCMEADIQDAVEAALDLALNPIKSGGSL